MALKDLIFNKGGIGVSMTREETVERLNPLIKQHMELNHGYAYVTGHLREAKIGDQLNRLQKTARVDVGKLMETVFSAGGVAYNGVELEPDAYDLGDDDDTMLFALRDQEEALRDALAEEMDLNHHIRTLATLKLVHQHSQERLDYLKTITRKRRRPTGSGARSVEGE